MLRRTRYTPSQTAAGPRQAVLLALGAAAALIAVWVGYGALDDRPPIGARTDSGGGKTLGLSGIHYDAARRAIVGQVRNYTDAPYANVSVTFDVLGPRREVLATVADSVGEVVPGGTWRFRIPVAASGVARVKLVRYAGARRGDPARVWRPVAYP